MVSKFSIWISESITYVVVNVAKRIEIGFKIVIKEVKFEGIINVEPFICLMVKYFTWIIEELLFIRWYTDSKLFISDLVALSIKVLKSIKTDFDSYTCEYLCLLFVSDLCSSCKSVIPRTCSHLWFFPHHILIYAYTL